MPNTDITTTDLSYPHTELEGYEDFDDVDYCYRCDGSGTILVCCDDMCQGMGECIHGDGEIRCPKCGGDV
jgi:hypothetical protein